MTSNFKVKPDQDSVKVHKTSMPNISVRNNFVQKLSYDTYTCKNTQPIAWSSINDMN